MNDDTFRERDNPFSSRFVRPGAISYRFAAGESAAQVVERFNTAGRRGQIVGPHGAGKSTLLASLMEEIAARGESVKHFELHDGQRSLSQPLEIAPKSIVCIDGYEQLCFQSRIALAWRIRRDACGLLITTHRAIRFPVALPVLVNVQPSAGDAVKLVMSLVAQHSAAGNAGRRPEEVERIFLEVHGDMRELFFRLYDLYESQRS